MNQKLNQAIRRILLAGTATAMTAGIIGMAQAAIKPGVQIPPPGPGQVPDYFGITPNYANSPQPVFAKIAITDPSGTGVGAIAAATTYDFNNPNYAVNPHGLYSSGLTQIGLVDGGSNYSLNPQVTISGNGSNAAATAHTNGIIAISVVSGGSGYASAPYISLSAPDIAGGVQATATAVITAGVVTAINITNAGSGYTIPPTISFGSGAASATASVNSTPGVITSVSIDNPGTGYTTPIAGTGIRKFVNDLSLPGTLNNLQQTLPIAVADTTSFPATATAPAADYYVIAEVEYLKQLHQDLPATHLRGYVQVFPDGTANQFTLAGFNGAGDKVAYASKYANYLGPVILAQKNRPSRIKFINLLSKSGDTWGSKGQLPFPVDHTYMGADKQDATGTYIADLEDNRTAVHLHGGNTPWISDGTPRQWFRPKGAGTGTTPPEGAVTTPGDYNKGVSAANVPDMWFDASGNLIPGCQGQLTCASGSNNPGDGALTFYYTNEQSARLMFYHDHAEGTTRLNVYDGLAAGYILQDPTEHAMTVGDAATTDENGHSFSKVLPADILPLVIQEKTFVPDNTTPVLNFYGPFHSQLNSQDPTWRWGTKGSSWDGISGGSVAYGQFDAAGAIGSNGPGDLWVPHVYMTNQNQGDKTGANALGRWDYGQWFWPPFKGILHGTTANPYADPTCTTKSAALNPTGTCEFAQIPGFPNGAITAYGANAPMAQPSGTPEAFNDTPLVNGTVYPYVNVEPKKYRLRLLSAGNDRTWNLSLWVASSKNSDTTREANVGPTSATANANLCDGSTAVSANPAECTEVRMVPFNSTQNGVSNFPAWWYSVLKGGITFDDRAGGVPDPAVRGPAMVQIGTEGGFLATPAVINNQPVNFEYNIKNIQVTNVKEHALLLSPAERADVVVDFSQFAGATLIMYNDGPSAIPAADLRLDYYTGDFDNTDTGGAFSTVPGYGPNSRTIMQFRVGTTANGVAVAPNAKAPASRDYVDPVYLSSLTNEVQKAFKFSQDPVVVPQEAYNATYGTNVLDTISYDPLNQIGGNTSAISDVALHFTPFNIDQTGTGTVSFEPAISLSMGPKAIQELFTMDYGRMNATLGTEVPNTTGLNQTTIPLGYIDPPTELVEITKNNPNLAINGLAQMGDGTQIWKITHNGVDTHPVHFHLFNVQIVNRVGWDGAIYPPEPNEVGWKETVRMNPLADVIVALRPKTMDLLPFKLPNSHHIADTSQAVGASANQSNLDPTTGNASNVNNQVLNYGLEYAWHCHILGHEENDFMRSIAVAQAPQDPTMISVVNPANTENMTVTWHDNSITSNWVTLQRSSDPSFPAGNTTVVKHLAQDECAVQTGCDRSYTDNVAGLGAGPFYYRVMSNVTVGTGKAMVKADPTASDVLPADLDTSKILPLNGAGFNNYSNVTAYSNWSTVANAGNPVAVASLAPAAGSTLAFGNQLLSASATQTVTLSNTGADILNIASVALSPASGSGFSIVNGCGATLAAGSSCNISVTFAPKVVGAAPATTLTITDNSNNTVNASQSLNLTGTGIAPVATVTPAGPLAFGNIALGQSSAVQTVTLQNTGNAPLTLNGIAITGTDAAQFVQSNACGSPLAAGASCSISVSFKPTLMTPAAAKSATLSITDNSGAVLTPVTQNVALTGTATVPTQPTTVVDNFNRLSANNLGANWNYATGSAIRVSGNLANSGNTGVSAFWKTALGANQGAGFTFANTTVNGNALYLKASGTFGNGRYQNMIRVTYTAGSVVVATTVNGNAATPTWTTVSTVATAGNLANGNTLKVAVDSTGKVWVWKVVGATTTLLTSTGVQLPNNALWTTGGGFVGMTLANGGSVDNFLAN